MLVIGENINATIPGIREMILGRDGEGLLALAGRQEEAGAGLIDINVGTGEGTAGEEMEAMRWLVGLLRDGVSSRLCIDSADPDVLRAGVEAGAERAGLINSVKATERNIAEVMPIAAGSGLPVIALALDEGGIKNDAASRLRACEKLLMGAEGHGVPIGNIYLDPLVMPISTEITHGVTTLETLKGIKEEFPGAKTILALSNVSFGLPRRALINQALLHMAMYLSVDAVMANPLSNGLMAAMRAGEAVIGRDRHCRRYSRAVRQAGDKG